MSDQTDGQDVLRRLEERVAALSDHVHALALSVAYDPAEPLEAFHARYTLTGTTRTAAMVVCSAVLARANGQVPTVVTHPDLLDAHPVIARAQLLGPIDLAEAVTVLGEVVGTQARVVEYLLAHRARGLSQPGTDYLGL